MDVHEIADAIRVLINTSPRSPTKDQLVGLLNARLLIQLSPASSLIHDCSDRGTKELSFTGHGSWNSNVISKTSSALGSWAHDGYLCNYCGAIVTRHVALTSYIDWLKEQYGLPSQKKWGSP